MIKLRHSDTTIEATDAADAVRQMRAGAHDQGRTELAYMRVVSTRAQVQTGKEVRVDSHQNFIADLVKAGLLEEVAS